MHPLKHRYHGWSENQWNVWPRIKYGIYWNTTWSNQYSVQLQPFYKYWSKLTIENGLIYRGTKVVIPESLTRALQQELHQSPMCMEKTKQFARQYYFWPSMNEDIEDLIILCHLCSTCKSTGKSPALLMVGRQLRTSHFSIVKDTPGDIILNTSHQPKLTMEREHTEATT